MFLGRSWLHRFNWPRPLSAPNCNVSRGASCSARVILFWAIPWSPNYGGLARLSRVVGTCLFDQKQDVRHKRSQTDAPND